MEIVKRELYSWGALNLFLLWQNTWCVLGYGYVANRRNCLQIDWVLSNLGSYITLGHSCVILLNCLGVWWVVRAARVVTFVRSLELVNHKTTLSLGLQISCRVNQVLLGLGTPRCPSIFWNYAFVRGHGFYFYRDHHFLINRLLLAFFFAHCCWQL